MAQADGDTLRTGRAAVRAARGGAPQPASLNRIQWTMAIAAVLGPVNSALVILALPAVRADFGIGVGATALLISTQLVGMTTAQPVGGRLGDAFGHLRVVRVALVLSLVTLVAAGLAWDFTFLVVMRFGQGVASGLLLPNTLAYLRRVAPIERLGSVIGWNASSAQLGATFGPLLGGALVALTNWRGVFLGNAVVVVVALVLVLRIPPDRGAGRRALVLDGWSVALLGVFLGAIAAVGSAVRFGQPAIVWTGVALVPASLALYALRFRRAGSGVVDLGLFRRPVFSAAVANAALVNFVGYNVWVVLPIYAVDVRGWSEGLSSVLLFLMTAAAIVLTLIAGPLTDRAGPRLPVSIASGMMFVGMVGVTAVLDGPPFWLVILPLSLVGSSFGLSMAPQQAAAIGAWPPSRAGSVSGTFMMMRQVGSVTGAALTAAMLGGDPTEADMRLLFAVMSVFAGAALAVAFCLRAGRPATE